MLKMTYFAKREKSISSPSTNRNDKNLDDFFQTIKIVLTGLEGIAILKIETQTIFIV